VSDADHAPYDAEIRSSHLKADSFIDYFLWDGAQRGRLTAAQVIEEVQLDNYAVMLCGRPEFVSESDEANFRNSACHWNESSPRNCSSDSPPDAGPHAGQR